MSTLSKKCLLFWVFSILCNLTTSDDFDDCEDNLHELFEAYNQPQQNFEIAMFALSEKLLSTMFTSNELYEYFAKHNDVINDIGDGIFSKNHKDMLTYFATLKSLKAAANFGKDLKKTIRRVLNSRSSGVDSLSSGVDSLSIGDSSSTIGDSSSTIGDSSSTIGDSSSTIGDSSSTIEDSSSSNNINKQADILGYFRSFANKIEEIASKIDNIVLSPQEFCKDRADYDEITCRQALSTMLNPRNVSSMLQTIAMSGSEALKYCFLNYTYLDFTTNNFFPQSDNNGSSIYLNESSKKDQIDIMIKYFNHLLDKTTKIGEINKKIGTFGMPQVGIPKNQRYVVPGEVYQDPPIFLTVERYCETTVKKKQ